MERRGAAEVISLDLNDPALIDFPVSRPDEALFRSELDAGNQAFDIARAALGSKVERRYRSVYDLRPEEVGEFDFAVLGTLLLHLRDPVSALRGIRRVLSGSLLMNEVVTSGLIGWSRRPMAELLMQGGPFWWICNPAGLERMVRAAGFEVTKTSARYRIPNGAGWHRQTVRSALGSPLRDIPRNLLILRGAPHISILADAAH